MASVIHTTMPAKVLGPERVIAGLGLHDARVAARRATAERVTAVGEHVGLFLLGCAVAMVLLRPGELIPEFEGLALHKYMIGACLAVAVGKAAAQCTIRALRGNAIVALVLALAPAVMLSHLARLDTLDARVGGWEMIKACALFVLLISLVDSVEKFRVILTAAGASIIAVAVLAVGQHLGLLHMPALEGVLQRDPSHGGAEYLRLRGTGLFNDPNDLSLALVMGGIICGYGLLEGGERGAAQHKAARWLLVLPIALLGYALVLTHSRGGLISALAAMIALLVGRLGWRNAAPLGLVLLASLLFPFWGRQRDLNIADPNDTFQSRVYLWGESLNLFRTSPLTGIGQGNVAEVMGQVTHNSFLHAFTEMGVIGGAAFVGAFYLLVRGLWQARPEEAGGAGWLARLRPFVLAIVVGYAAGLLSLSRCYTVPTQLVLGLGTAYLGLAARAAGATSVPVLPRLDWKCVRRVARVSAIFLLGIYVFVRIMLLRGGHP